jgi:hypothetical protein
MNEIGFVPKERWASLPVQPPAGYWRRRRRWLGVGVAAAAGWLTVVGALVVTGSAPVGLRLWEPLVPFVFLSGAGVLMSVRQARAERAESEHGYRTIPSRKATASQHRSI